MESVAAESSNLLGAISEAIRDSSPPKMTPSDVVERAVFVSIKIRKPGASKKIDSGKFKFNDGADDGNPSSDVISEESDAAASEEDTPKDRKKVDADMIRVSKKLIDCKEFAAIQTIDSKIKSLIRKRCMPSAIRDGIFLLAASLINEVDEKVQTLTAARAKAIEAYGAVYDARVKEALEKLGPAGDASDYPPWSVVKQTFGVSVQYLTLGVPAVLGDVNQAIFQREQQRVAAQVDDMLENGRRGLRKLMSDLVESLASCVETNPDGTKKRIQARTVENLSDFLRVFDAQNSLTNDDALAVLADKARALLDGVDIKALRDDDGVRKQVSEGMQQIKASLSSLVIEEPTRAITFDD